METEWKPPKRLANTTKTWILKSNFVCTGKCDAAEQQTIQLVIISCFHSCSFYDIYLLAFTQKWSNTAILEKRHGRSKKDQVLIEIRVVCIA